MNIQKNILFTKRLNRSEISFAGDLQIDSFDFIEIENLQLTHTFSDPLPPYLIFTSRNAVFCVAQTLPISSTQVIYAVGKQTAKTVQSLWRNEIRIPKDETADGLITLLEQENTNDFLYICGKRRRKTLEEFLIKETKKYRILEAYNTCLSPPENLPVEKYDILCFCSPSAVESYGSYYSFLPHHQTVAIGNTTANKLSEYTKQIEIAPQTSVKGMLDYLKKQIL